MTWDEIRQWATKAVVVGFSGGFLISYVVAKVAVWPLGAWSY